MENHEETGKDRSRANGKTEVHEVKILEKMEVADNCTELEASKQNLDFGAEIINSKISAATESEGEIKTNTVNITSTAKALTSADEQKVATETPLSVAELPVQVSAPAPQPHQPPTSSLDTSKATAGEENDKDGIVEGESDCDAEDDEEENDEDDDDDDESYQSDDEIENDNSQESEGHERNRSSTQIDASQDSDESTSDSDFSDLSGLSDVSGREWKPISARPLNWVQKQIHSGANPRHLLSQMLPSSVTQIAPGIDDMMLWRILASIVSEPPRRQKLRNVNTFEDVIQLVERSKNIIVLTGAGVSVSCGIPDFRSSDGIYSRLAKDFPDLPDPQAMFDINYFSRDPRPFFKFAREIYPGQFKPSPCHRFIKLLEQKQKLLRNYTQNIDTLEQVAGISNVIECHGSFSTASCTKCKIKCTADAIRDDIFAQRIPVCRRCQPNVNQSVDASEPVSEAELRQLVENGIMKPDIVFFGEGLPDEFHKVMGNDKDNCDLLIVMGSSLKVRPVALIPSSIPAEVPQILINREQLHHLEFDVELLGDSDVIINQLCHHLGGDWKDICFDDVVLKESKELLPLEEDSTEEGEVEDETQQLHDTDTQSVKSNASTDIALRSAGAYSDSGFESSTSSGVVVGKSAPVVVNENENETENNEALQKIKTSILKLENSLTKAKSSAILGPDFMDEPVEAVDFDNHGFRSFTVRLGQEAESVRHLSIDSSKDSGIQCDSSNSAIVSNTSVGYLPPPKTKFEDTGGTAHSVGSEMKTVSASLTCNTTAADTTQTEHDLNEGNKAIANTITTGPCQEKKHLSAAERLLEGTYYWHEASSSYVFPGAQVSWSSDSEDDENDEDYDENINDFVDDDGDTNAAPISPIFPPSVEAEMVSEITTTSAFAACARRHLPTDAELEMTTVGYNNTSNKTCPLFSAVTTHHTTEATDAGYSPPPMKRRRDNDYRTAESLESYTTIINTTATTTTAAAAATFIAAGPTGDAGNVGVVTTKSPPTATVTTTTNSGSGSGSGSSSSIFQVPNISKSAVETPLLQHF